MKQTAHTSLRIFLPLDIQVSRVALRDIVPNCGDQLIFFTLLICDQSTVVGNLRQLHQLDISASYCSKGFFFFLIFIVAAPQGGFRTEINVDSTHREQMLRDDRDLVHWRCCKSTESTDQLFSSP